MLPTNNGHYYAIQNRATGEQFILSKLFSLLLGMVLDHYAGKSIQAFNGDAHHHNHQWKAIFVDGEYFALQNRATGKVLDHWAQRKIETFDSNIHDRHHQWKIASVNGEWFALVNRASKNALDHYYGKSIQAFNNDTNHPHHQWRLIPSAEVIAAAIEESQRQAKALVEAECQQRMLEAEIQRNKELVDEAERKLKESIPFKQHQQLTNFFSNSSYKIQYCSEYAVIGSKGFGKSTFLWLKGIGEKPQPSLCDGTIEIDLNNIIMDTVGMDITIPNMIKLIALFIVKGFPKNLILASNDRIESVLQVLSHFFVTSVYFFIMKPQELHEQTNITHEEALLLTLPTIYSMGRMKQIQEVFPTCQLCTHLTELTQISSIQPMIDSLFPMGKVIVPNFQEYDQKKMDSRFDLNYQILQAIYSFVNDFGGNTCDFMNATLNKNY